MILTGACLVAILGLFTLTSAKPQGLLIDPRNDPSGRYVPDNSGQYVPDNSGQYVPDGQGRYNAVINPTLTQFLPAQPQFAPAPFVAPYTNQLSLNQLSLGQYANPYNPYATYNPFAQFYNPYALRSTPQPFLLSGTPAPAISTTSAPLTISSTPAPITASTARPIIAAAPPRPLPQTNLIATAPASSALISAPSQATLLATPQRTIIPNLQASLPIAQRTLFPAPQPTIIPAPQPTIIPAAQPTLLPRYAPGALIQSPNNHWRILRLENDQNEVAYRYAYETENGIAAGEEGHLDQDPTNPGQPILRTTGSYSYVGDDGKVYTVTYTADERGFIPQGAHIPAGAAPATAQVIATPAAQLIAAPAFLKKK